MSKQDRLREIKEVLKDAKFLRGVRVFNGISLISDSDHLEFLITELDLAWRVNAVARDMLGKIMRNKCEDCACGMRADVALDDMDALEKGMK